MVYAPPTSSTTIEVPADRPPECVTPVQQELHDIVAVPFMNYAYERIKIAYPGGYVRAKGDNLRAWLVARKTLDAALHPVLYQELRDKMLVKLGTHGICPLPPEDEFAIRLDNLMSTDRVGNPCRYVRIDYRDDRFWLSYYR